MTGSLSFSISQITGEVNQNLPKSKALDTSLSSPVRNDQSIHSNNDSPSTSVNSNFQSSSQCSNARIHKKYDSNTSHSTPSGNIFINDVES